MRFAKNFLGFLALHASFSLGEYLVELKSVQPEEVVDRFKTGCIFTGTKVIYQCVKTESTESSDRDHSDAELPQFLNFRIDCRGARGNFQNLTLFDRTRSCGRLSYRKYGNSDIKRPMIGELPLFSDHSVTIEKEDVLDIQCVPFDMKFYFGYLIHLDDQQKADIKEEFWTLPFSLLQDGQRERSYFALRFGMFHRGSGLDTCTKTLAMAYRWKMNVSHSIDFNYWIRYSSPSVQSLQSVEAVPQANSIRSIFPKVDGFCCDISGEIFQVDKDILHLTVLEATSYSILNGPEEFTKTNQWLVRLDPDFYSSTIDSNRFGMDFKLEVNPDELLPDTTDIKVKLQLVRLKIGAHDDNAHLSFELTLPVNNTGLEDSVSESRVIWIIAFVFFICLLCGFCYLYQEDFISTGPQLRDPNARNPMVEENAVSIELQGS